MPRWIAWWDCRSWRGWSMLSPIALQTQEHLTAQVAGAINAILKPRGVAVVMEAEHTCMSVRGIAKEGAKTLTTRFNRDFPGQSRRAGPFPHMVRGV